MKTGLPIQRIPPTALLAAVLGALLASEAPGQAPAGDARAGQPAGPALAPAPEFARWVIQPVQPEGGGKPSAGDRAFRKITVVKTGQIVREEFEEAGGGVYTKWQVGQTLYVKPPDQAAWGEIAPEQRERSPSSDPRSTPLPATGFRGMEWVTWAHCAGELEVGGRRCLAFVPRGASGEAGAEADFAAIRSEPEFLLLDAATRLPRLQKRDGLLWQYDFLEAPASPLRLPPDLEAAIEEGKARRAKVFTPPRREY